MSAVVALLAVALLALAIALGTEVVTAFAATLALVGAVLTLGHADATARRGRTAEYRARWDHTDLRARRVAAAEFLTLGEPAEGHDTAEDARWELWNEWGDDTDGIGRRLDVMAVLNFWEEVASAYNQRLLDNAWFRTDLAWQMMHNWERAEWFIRRYRIEAEDADFFCEWQVAIQSLCAYLARQSYEARHRARTVGPREDILYISRD